MTGTNSIFRASALAATAFLLLILSAFTADPAAAQVTGISYTITPSVERINFGENAGLGNEYLFGGRIGFGFGEFVELNGLYLYNPSIVTDFTRYPAPDDLSAGLTGLPGREVSIERFGAEFRVNLARTGLLPFVQAGTGILRLNPENIAPTRTIYLSGGGGLQYSVADRYTLNVRADYLTFRHDVGVSLLSEVDRDDLSVDASAFGLRPVDNLALGVGLQIYLGGRARGQLTAVDAAFLDQFGQGLRGLVLQVEPSTSWARLGSALGFAEELAFTGLHAGVDFGPFVGLRGFYWRARTDGTLFEFEPIQAYGGEVKLNFAAPTSGIVPHILFGAGFLDVGDDYVGPTGLTPDSRPFATGGGGLSIPLAGPVRIQGSIRALLMTERDIDDLNDPGDVRPHYMYSVGLSLGLGRRTVPAAALHDRELQRTRDLARTDVARLSEELQRREAEIAASEARIAELGALLERAQQGDEAAARLLAAEMERRRLEPPRRDAPVPPALAAPSDRFVTLPVPVEGEIYIRYGPAGGVFIESLTGDAPVVIDGTGAAPRAVTGEALTAEQIRQIVRQTVREEIGTAPLDQTVAMQMERRLEERMIAFERSLDRRLAEIRGRDPVIIQTPGAVRLTPDGRIAGPGTRLNAIMPFAGLNIGDPVQITAGVRADLSTPTFSPFHLLIDGSAGLGVGNTSYNLHTNLALPFSLRRADPLRYYAGGGLGIKRFNDQPEGVPDLQVVLNVLGGAEYFYRFGYIFGEYMTSNFFDYNRFAAGFRFEF
jgi:hypothetical protein